MNVIAQTLLGDNANASNLDSLENILASLPKNQADELLAQLEQDPNWTVVRENVSLADANHNRIVMLTKAILVR